ncbi:MAG: hypothetical protein K6U14_07285 [Firmicutes bacterium]|nr:hypothetical protein [Alicyclobacillaceae bacterium]MCL6497421.1 hypothetical protein [Bacillota bacterium]
MSSEYAVRHESTPPAIRVEWRRRQGNPTEGWTWGEWRPVPAHLELREYDRFQLRWEGPEAATLVVEGLDPVPAGQMLEWDQPKALWFPGSYAVAVRLRDHVLWEGRIEVKPQRPHYASFPEHMIAELESWVPGLCREYQEGVLAHADWSAPMADADLNRAAAYLDALTRVLIWPEGEFRRRPGPPSLTFNTRDHRVLRDQLRWLARFLGARLRAVEAAPLALAGLDERRQRLRALHHRALRLLEHPVWDTVEPAEGSPSRLTQRGARRRRYRRAQAAFQELRRGLGPPERRGPHLTRMRPTSQIYELWVLRQLVQLLAEQGWKLQEEPTWVRLGRRMGLHDPVPLASRFRWTQGPWTLLLDYDRPLPDQGSRAEETDGLWMSGQHNRPDFLLTYWRGDLPAPLALIMEVKYQPRQRLWPDEPTGPSARGQLSQYWSALMYRTRHLDPPVICIIPEQPEVVWRADTHPDIEFVAVTPRPDAVHWREVMADRLRRALEVTQEGGPRPQHV